MHHQNVMNAVCAQSSEESCYHESLSIAFIIIAKIKFSTWVMYLFNAYLQTPFRWGVNGQMSLACYSGIAG